MGRAEGVAGAGVGNRLLRFAFEKALAISHDIGVSGIVLEALKESLVPRYRKYGFVVLPYSDPEKRRMFMDMRTVGVVIAEMRRRAGNAKPGTTTSG